MCRFAEMWLLSWTTVCVSLFYLCADMLVTQTPKDAQLIYASDATCHAFKEGQFPLRNPDSMLAY